MSFSLAASLKTKMSHTPVEQSVMDLIVLFYKYTKPDDRIDKQGLLKMLKGNFPIFLKACVSRGDISRLLGPWHGRGHFGGVGPWTRHSHSLILNILS